MSQARLMNSGSLSDYALKKYGQSITKNPTQPKWIKPKATPKNKSDFGFYPSSDSVVKELIKLAHIEKHHTILEPSAGQGHILDQLESKNITLGELQQENKLILESKGYKVAFDNFLKWNPGVKFDRIIMNPPFWNQADIIHVMHAYSLLKKGGRLVSVMSNGVTFRDNQNTNDFRKLIENNGLIKNLPENSFKDAGTNVKTVIVILSKEAVKE